MGRGGPTSLKSFHLFSLVKKNMYLGVFFLATLFFLFPPDPPSPVNLLASCKQMKKPTENDKVSAGKKYLSGCSNLPDSHAGGLLC